MNADVSRALAGFISELGLSQASARQLAIQFAEVESVADLPDWIRESGSDTSPGGGVDPKGDGAVRASHPGQRYRHGWIPINPVADLQAAVDSGEVSREELSGGTMGDVSLVDHNNGTRTVHKKLGDVSDTMGDGYEPERQADAEELSSKLGLALGAPVVGVLRTGDDEIVAEFANGEVAVGIEGRMYEAAKTRMDFMSVPTRAAQEHARIAGTPEGIRLGLFDLLTGNWDRANTGNWLYTDQGTPVGIDHSFTFDGGDAMSADLPPRPMFVGPFAQQFVRPENENENAWASNLLTPADVAWVRKRLEELEGEFDSAGRHDWWAFAMARLDAIEPYARGTESRFAE